MMHTLNIFSILNCWFKCLLGFFITSYVSVSFLSAFPRFRLRTLKTEYDTRQIIIITVNKKKKQNIQFEKTGSIEVQLRLPAAFSCSYPRLANNAKPSRAVLVLQ